MPTQVGLTQKQPGDESRGGLDGHRLGSRRSTAWCGAFGC